MGLPSFCLLMTFFRYCSEKRKKSCELFFLNLTSQAKIVRIPIEFCQTVDLSLLKKTSSPPLQDTWLTLTHCPKVLKYQQASKFLFLQRKRKEN